MKESRFIELLNLYLDQQISPEDAAELEAEIVRSPAHRRTYLQYCRMHRACALLFENFRAPAAPLAQDAHRADGKVTDFPERRFRFLPAAGMAGLAVAVACVALVLVERSEVAQVNIPPESFHAVAVNAPAPAPGFQTVMTARKFSLAADSHSTLEAQQAAFDWMNQIELSPMPAVDNRQMVFGSQPEPAASDARFQQLGRANQPAVEMTAFEFQP